MSLDDMGETSTSMDGSGAGALASERRGGNGAALSGGDQTAFVSEKEDDALDGPGAFQGGDPDVRGAGGVPDK
jgi:hypothetical protein